MVTLSRLYLRGVRVGGVPGSPAPSRGSGGERSQSSASSCLGRGRYPGPAFLGLPTYFPTVSGWAGRGAAAKRAGAAASSAAPGASCRPRSRASCREHFGGARRCRGGTAPRSISRAHGAPTPGSAGGWRLLPGPSLPAPAAGAGAASASLSPPSIPTCRSLPGRAPLLVGRGGLSAPAAQWRWMR